MTTTAVSNHQTKYSPIAPSVSTTVSTEAQSPLQIVTDAQGVTLIASPLFLALGDAVALARTLLHDGNRTASQDLGSVGNIRADKWGTRAEVITLLALELRGYSPKDYCFLDVKPPQRLEDFRLDIARYDIKACSPGDPFLKVNEAKRLRCLAEGVKLLPCQFLTDNALRLYKPVSAASAGTWELMTTGRTPYRRIPFALLAPLACLPRAKAVKHTATGDVILDEVLRLFGGTVIGQWEGGAN